MKSPATRVAGKKGAEAAKKPRKKSQENPEEEALAALR